MNANCSEFIRVDTHKNNYSTNNANTNLPAVPPTFLAAKTEKLPRKCLNQEVICVKQTLLLSSYLSMTACRFSFYPRHCHLLLLK